MKDEIIAAANRMYVKFYGQVNYKSCLKRCIKCNQIIDLYAIYGITIDDYIDYLDEEAHK